MQQDESPICLIGDAVDGRLAELAGRLRGRGACVNVAPSTASACAAVFCISIENGVDEGTCEAISRLGGARVRPAAIVITGSKQMPADYIDWITREMRNIVASIADRPAADRMPVIFADRPEAVDQIVAAVNSNLTEFEIPVGLDPAKLMEAGDDEPATNPEPKSKPWWRFW